MLLETAGIGSFLLSFNISSAFFPRGRALSTFENVCSFIFLSVGPFWLRSNEKSLFFFFNEWVNPLIVSKTPISLCLRQRYVFVSSHVLTDDF